MVKNKLKLRKYKDKYFILDLPILIQKKITLHINPDNPIEHSYLGYIGWTKEFCGNQWGDYVIIRAKKKDEGRDTLKYLSERPPLLEKVVNLLYKQFQDTLKREKATEEKK